MPDGRTDLGVDVLDELVEILEPLISVLELEVAAHGHNNVIGGETNGLEQENAELPSCECTLTLAKRTDLIMSHTNELSNTFGNIVVVKSIVVL